MCMEPHGSTPRVGRDVVRCSRTQTPHEPALGALALVLAVHAVAQRLPIDVIQPVRKGFLAVQSDPLASDHAPRAAAAAARGV